jgi:hypothetical protein
MAAAPFPLDLGAPAFGQSMSAAALAFSAAGGFDVGNFAPMTQLHPREMVLPARLADPIRDMVANHSSGLSGMRSGDVHHHYNTSFSSQFGAPKSFKRQLAEHESDVSALVERSIRRAVRSGRIK